MNKKGQLQLLAGLLNPLVLLGAAIFVILLIIFVWIKSALVVGLFLMVGGFLLVYKLRGRMTTWVGSIMMLLGLLAIINPGGLLGIAAIEDNDYYITVGQVDYDVPSPPPGWRVVDGTWSVSVYDADTGELFEQGWYGSSNDAANKFSVKRVNEETGMLEPRNFLVTINGDLETPMRINICTGDAREGTLECRGMVASLNSINCELRHRVNGQDVSVEVVRCDQPYYGWPSDGDGGITEDEYDDYSSPDDVGQQVDDVVEEPFFLHRLWQRIKLFFSRLFG